MNIAGVDANPQSITDPHEFGGFWRRLLNYSDMTQKVDESEIDFERAAKTLDDISRVFGKSVSRNFVCSLCFLHF